MEYRVLTEEERDDIIVAFFLEQERERFCLELNRERFSRMIKALPPGEWRDKVSKLHSDTVQRLLEVDSIIEATQGQLPSRERIEAAKERRVDGHRCSS